MKWKRVEEKIYDMEEKKRRKRYGERWNCIDVMCNK